jgi:type IV pilus assembly protein PilY1
MVHLKQINNFAASLPVCYRHRRLSILVGTLLWSILLLQATPLVAGTTGSLDLADEPLMAKIKPAPANIMILLDDSGSMNFEIVVQDEKEGRYPLPADYYNSSAAGDTGNGLFAYVFDDPWHSECENTENTVCDYRYDVDEWYLKEKGRRYWMSQWHRVNVLYYDPAVTYEPWPGYANADPDTPRSNPVFYEDHKINLDATSFTAGEDVPHAHYFLWSDADSRPYLVILDGQSGTDRIRYFSVTVSGSGLGQLVTGLIEVSAEKAGQVGVVAPRSYAAERQNFANWYTYYRRRDFVAKNALAKVILSLRNVRVGIYGINEKIVLPLKDVKVNTAEGMQDYSSEVVKALFHAAVSWNGGTPLKRGLDTVGQYYMTNDGKLGGQAISAVAGLKPYGALDEGAACQQSFTIIVTDGYYSDVGYDSKAGNADGDKNNPPRDGGFYGDKLADTLADIAMYYYETDLSDEEQGGLPDLVYGEDRLQKSIVDTADHQHMVTYGVAFGVAGTQNPDDFNRDPSSEDYMKCINSANCNPGDYPQWPTYIPDRSDASIDDLFHATVNGRGVFFSAQNPQQLSDALAKLIKSILGRLGSASSVAINGDALYGQISDDVLMFQASYQTTDWSGDVRAFRVDILTGKVLVDDLKWSAADSLDKLNDTQLEQRNVLSYNGSYGIPFVYDAAEMTTNQRMALGWDGVTGSDSEQQAENVVNFVRGRAIDGFRSRNSRLGDIVHASPVFKNDVLYVGANDGMLHAFEIKVDYNGSVSGDEIFAYVPSFVYENLVELTDPAYSHKYFVDLTPTVKKGVGLLGGTEDETILVGGLGKGGKGYFALNITAPQAMDAAKVLWEFPGADMDDAADMGYSFIKPVVVRSNDENHPWVVIFGNGYDSENENAVLFIRDPKYGNKITTINTNVGPANGLSSPTPVDVNQDGKVDFVFAGDLQGNMWKFDLTAEDSTQWTVAYADGDSPQPLFTARGPAGTTQPITTKPEVMLHPEQHGLMVLFGTGKFLGDSDFTDNSPQTIYGIWDYGDRAFFSGEWGLYSNDDDTEYLGYFKRSDLGLYNQPPTVTLLEQTSSLHTVTILDENNNPVDIKIRVMSGHSPTWITEAENPAESNGRPNLPDLSATVANHAGWFSDLPEDGERVISDVLLRDGRLIVIGFTPDPDRCSAGGSSFLMEINTFNGGSFGGSIFDLNDNRLFDTKDSVIVGYDAETDELIRAFPAGIKIQGNIQPPAILRLNNLIEVKYLSSSTGAVYKLNERAVRLGMTYWKELEQN